MEGRAKSKPTSKFFTFRWLWFAFSPPFAGERKSRNEVFFLFGTASQAGEGFSRPHKTLKHAQGRSVLSCSSLFHFGNINKVTSNKNERKRDENEPSRGQRDEIQHFLIRAGPRCDAKVFVSLSDTSSCHINTPKRENTTQQPGREPITTLMSLMNEIHRNQINVKQLIIRLDTIKRVCCVSDPSTLSSRSALAFIEQGLGSMGLTKWDG